VIGTLVCDEHIYPIERVALEAGGIRLYAFPMPGPVSVSADSEVHVHAPDGALVAIGPWNLPASVMRLVRAAGEHDTVHLSLLLQVRDVDGRPA
jgi:hypothetical protein